MEKTFTTVINTSKPFPSLFTLILFLVVVISFFLKTVSPDHHSSLSFSSQPNRYSSLFTLKPIATHWLQTLLIRFVIAFISLFLQTSSSSSACNVLNFRFVDFNFLLFFLHTSSYTILILYVLDFLFVATNLCNSNFDGEDKLLFQGIENAFCT